MQEVLSVSPLIPKAFSDNLNILQTIKHVVVVVVVVHQWISKG
jgi:hypothetical protein